MHLVDDHVRGDRLHNQLYLLPDRPSLWALDATGSTERLAELAAEWFRAVLDKPIVLYVCTARAGSRPSACRHPPSICTSGATSWLHDGYAYAARYAFADSGETICQSYAESMAPHGQAAELKAAGHVRAHLALAIRSVP
ncbi:hypothetical protein [Streptomyces mirabilis]|uniref:hypothetical protein n=1 Tax=Streptomyces mirabilis TaxID=68239 RepID=UPI0036BB0A30